MINRALAAAGASSVRFWGSKLGAKTYRKTIKNEFNMGRHLRIDFELILVAFGRRVGVENRAKRHQTWHRKNNEKMKGAKMLKKSRHEPPTTRGTTGPRPRGVGRGRGESFPRGVETRKVEKKRAENRYKYTTLNHPSPEGWWD